MEDARRLLHDLLVRVAPSAAWIKGLLGRQSAYRGVLSGLPDISTSTEHYADMIVRALEAHGLVDEQLFELIEAECPDERPAVNDLRRALGLPTRIETPLTFDALMDNWLHQQVAFLFVEGVIDEPAHGVVVAHDELAFRPEPNGGVALEALISLLTTLVIHDRILVDEDFTFAWDGITSPLRGLEAGEIIVPVAKPENLGELRTPLYRQLYASGALRAMHQRLVTFIREHGHYPENYESQVLWGTVGGLARSVAFDVAYTAHPIRQRFLVQTPFASDRTNAGAILLDALAEVQIDRLATLAATLVHDVRAMLPPIALHIVREAKDPTDLFVVALQLRERFRDVRTWLALFQKALRQQDRPRILEHYSALRSALTSLQGPNAFGPQRHDTFARTVLGLPGLHRRAALLFDTLFVRDHDREAVDKLFSLFGVLNTSLDAELREHLFRTTLKATS